MGVCCLLDITNKDLRMSREQSIAVYRIFEEILTNVARHAKATKLWVRLGEEDDVVILEVEDDGIGFSPAELGERQTIGLLGMRERAAIFGGEVELAGAPGKGTTVIVRIPVTKSTDENSDC